MSLAAASMVLVLAGGFMMLRGGSTPVSPESAVARFRDKQRISIAQVSEAAPVSRDASDRATGKRVQAKVTTEIATEPGLRPRPAEGVYVYATKGGDDVDVLGGSRHTYPAQTTITIRHTDCGFIEHWDALEERWDEREFCQTPSGDLLKRFTSFHEFFGRADQRTFSCTGYSYPAGFEPGKSWTSTCTTETTKAVTTLTAIAWDMVDVGGTKVRTMRVHASTKLSGEQTGSSERDVWGSRDSGLVVQERVEMTSYSTQPVFGKTKYHEAYEVRLTSVEPRR
jgi:hypothetical protein